MKGRARYLPTLWHLAGVAGLHPWWRLIVAVRFVFAGRLRAETVGEMRLGVLVLLDQVTR